jgi:hypothetical protein
MHAHAIDPKMVSLIANKIIFYNLAQMCKLSTKNPILNFHNLQKVAIYIKEPTNNK